MFSSKCQHCGSDLIEPLVKCGDKVIFHKEFVDEERGFRMFRDENDVFRKVPRTTVWQRVPQGVTGKIVRIFSSKNKYKYQIEIYNGAPVFASRNDFELVDVESCS
jgi:hypothetical protein